MIRIKPILRKEDGNDMDSYLVKYNDKTQHSETTEDSKKGVKPTPEEPERRYHFQRQSKISQHWFDLDPNWIEDSCITKATGF